MRIRYKLGTAAVFWLGTASLLQRDGAHTALDVRLLDITFLAAAD